jgi:ParB/RepB/Spo0J family partition protein
MTAKTYETTLIHRSQIGVDTERNARRTLYGAPLDELAQSIRDVGLLQPVGVRPYAEGKYLLVWGYRRLRALDKLGMELIPAVVVPVDEATAYEMMLAENVHREDVAPWDIGAAVCGLIDQGFDMQTISHRMSMVIGKSLKMNRVQRLAVACRGLIPELLEVWKRGVGDFGEVEAYQVAQLPEAEQEQYFHDLCGDMAPHKRPPESDAKKKRRKGRPTIRTIELAYVSVRQHDDDEHEDGLHNDSERAAVRAMLQWILGGRTKCPVKLRKRKKVKGKEVTEPVTAPTESVPVRKKEAR